MIKHRFKDSFGKGSRGEIPRAAMECPKLLNRWLKESDGFCYRKALAGKGVVIEVLAGAIILFHLPQDLPQHPEPCLSVWATYSQPPH